LEAKRSSHFRGRADESEAVGTDDVGEARVLRQEPVAGMDRVAACHDRGRDQGGGRQIAAPGVRRADADRLVGELGGQAVAVGLAVGDHRATPRVRQARRIRSAISPRLAIRILLNIRLPRERRRPRGPLR